MSSLPDARSGVATRSERGAEPGRGSAREGAVLRGAAAQHATPYQSGMPDRRMGDRRVGGRRASDHPAVTATNDGRPTLKLGDVYAEELARLRAQAHAEGFAAGHAEGMTAAAAVVAEAERAAV